VPKHSENGPGNGEEGQAGPFGALYYLQHSPGEPVPGGPWEMDRETGELFQRCPDCILKDDEIKGLKTNLKGWQLKYAQLRREKEAEARASEWWPVAVVLFGIWKDLTGHLQSAWSYDRFVLVVPFLSAHGPTLCERAIAGIAFDHYSAPRKNGTTQHYNEWERCFKDSGQFERFANAAPQGWQPTRRWDELSPLQRIPSIVDEAATA
jgi:hypothetical protein